MSENAIALQGVTKTFGPKVAVRELDLAVPRGGIYGFIGPNGAGKTTTIRMVMSILFPDEGEITVLDHPSALDAKDRIGYLPEERGVYRKMKVRAFLRYMGHLKNLGGRELESEIDRWLERVELADIAAKPCEELSKGMQQKIQFIAAVIHKPELLILDEPFSGLDPVNMRLLRELIREEHRRGTTIIFSTHVMFQAQELCDHIIMIHDGDKVLDDSLESIRTRYDPRHVLLEPLDPDADVEAALGGLEGIVAVEPEDPRGDGGRAVHGLYEVALAEGADPRKILGSIVAAVPPARVELKRPSLEDVFIEIVSRSRGDSARELRDALQTPAMGRPA